MCEQWTLTLCAELAQFGTGGVLSWYSVYIYSSIYILYLIFPFSVLLAPTATAGGAVSPASGGVRIQLFSSHPVLQ